jgi:hypothetical protein
LPADVEVAAEDVGVACGRGVTWGDVVERLPEVNIMTQPDPHPIYTALVAKHGDPGGSAEAQEPVDRHPEPQESLRSRSSRAQHRE